jgi:hypothetical protein
MDGGDELPKKNFEELILCWRSKQNVPAKSIQKLWEPIQIVFLNPDAIFKEI